MLGLYGKGFEKLKLGLGNRERGNLKFRREGKGREGKEEDKMMLCDRVWPPAIQR